jgi:arginase
MKVQLIQVPYDSGHRGRRMGGGPEHFIENSVEQALRSSNYDFHIECVEARSSFRAEIKTAFELSASLAERVSSACDIASFPLVISGNCNSCLGILAGIGTDRLGIIWFDSHGDFNTPETTQSGFLDGMGLATAAGLCWKRMAASIPHFKPISAGNILHVGGRDFDSEEKKLFEEAGGNTVRAEAIRESSIQDSLGPALADLRNRVSRIYLHFDLDVLDPEVARANEFAAPNGLSVVQIEEAIRMIGQQFVISAAAIAAYDPQYDQKGEVLDAGIAIMKTILATVTQSRA